MRYILLGFYFFILGTIQGQTDEARLVKALLSETPIEEDLQELCDNIGGRVTGTLANEEAVEWAYQKFIEAGLNPKKQSFRMEKKWVPGETSVRILGSSGEYQTQSVSKYMSPNGSYQSELILIKDLKEETIRSVGQAINGKFIIVPSEICFDIPGLFAEYTFAKQVEDLARKYNARGIIFMSSRPNKLLYTFIGSKGINNDTPQIIMAREDAKRCIRRIENGEKVFVEIHIDAEQGAAFEAENVLAEIPGTTFPNEVILIGAHLDSWNLGTGANDNGCNVSMIIDIARQLKQQNIQPKRTIRFALWNGEEQGYFGSWAYTKANQNSLDQHKMVLSVDIGSGAISGFFTNGRDEIMKDIDEVLQPVNQFGPFTQLNVPIVGTDNFDFMLEGVPNLVANHLSASYGLNYHAASDTYDKVDLKTLKNNSAIVGALTLGLANRSLPKESWKRHSRSEIQQIFEEHNLEFTMRMFDVWDPWINGRRGLKK